jgi:uncharacterized protein YkwD
MTRKLIRIKNKNKNLFLATGLCFVCITMSVITIFGTSSSNLANASGPAKISIDKGLILQNINEIRTENNLKPLVSNPLLELAAQKKAEKIIETNTFAHELPNTPKFSEEIFDEGYNYTKVGENLAKGYFDEAETVNAWMESDSHKQNILDPEFTDNGIAITSGLLNAKETLIIVQEFGSQDL